jgi:hypothetical protein
MTPNRTSERTPHVPEFRAQKIPSAATERGLCQIVRMWDDETDDGIKSVLEPAR